MSESFRLHLWSFTLSTVGSPLRAVPTSNASSRPSEQTRSNEAMVVSVVTSLLWPCTLGSENVRCAPQIPKDFSVLGSPEPQFHVRWPYDASSRRTVRRKCINLPRSQKTKNTAQRTKSKSWCDSVATPCRPEPRSMLNHKVHELTIILIGCVRLFLSALVHRSFCGWYLSAAVSLYTAHALIGGSGTCAYGAHH